MTEYKYANFKPHFPVVNWEPLTEQEVTDRALFADSEKKALFSAAQKVKHLTPVIGTEVTGIDLRQLTPAQKDELALLVAERGVVFFRDQELNIHEQLELARYFGPLHKHATTGVPREPGLEEVHVVYNNVANRPNPVAFAKFDLWHSDVSYEIQPPSTTFLKVITSPEYGGDTLWTSGYALYSSLSPGFQKYLEGLAALHSAVAQAEGARAQGLHVRREPVENIHPVVRAGSDAILQFLFLQLSENVDFQVRFRWETNSVAIWDNRVVTHSATFDFWPQTRHALRTTPHGEKPESVAGYERRTGKKQGIEPPQADTEVVKVRGYND
ncbi:alpha-ketoglutarate-dependent sulfonate dioxygenase [Pisolithus orientalis]|uniref:alpha-ketoglutarate-dependent sulfonate dioxygenase n=1 Tax=Pisolithus orientalis TaxID=936130 RepID=UPI0022250C36|nr:alpha-ketoglutarate-dependent sulfonate dioxygenase [Pisolithus orientalis]KAI6025683.1 alpha-ketoglutarate-dependent sulfonate dioxygenase [Pisolithus orientalis]